MIKDISIFVGRELVRGFTIAVLNVDKCTSTEERHYDTFSSLQHALDMNKYLESLPHGSVIAGVTADEASG